MISSLAVVETDRLGHGVRVAEFAVVRAGSELGDRAIVHPHVVIEEGVIVGPGVEIFPGCHLGKVPRGAGALTRPLVVGGRVEIGSGCVMGPHAVVYQGVLVGDETLIGDGSSLREQSVVGSRCVVGRHVTINYETRLGDRVKVMDHAWLAGRMEVGDDVFISGGVLTANDPEIGAAGYDEDRIRGPLIEAEVRIGAGAILLPGITIGKGAVVGAGAVVTSDVEPRSQVRGIPARLVRRISEKQK